MAVTKLFVFKHFFFAIVLRVIFFNLVCILLLEDKWQGYVKCEKIGGMSPGQALGRRKNEENVFLS